MPIEGNDNSTTSPQQAEKLLTISPYNTEMNILIDRIKKYITEKGHINIDLPILMSRDSQDGVFIEDSKIFKTPTKSLRYDLTLPLFYYCEQLGINETIKSFSVGSVFRVEDEDVSHLSEFHQFEIDIINSKSIEDDVLIGQYMKEMAKMFFGDEIIELRINYRPLTEWLITLSVVSNRQEFYNKLDAIDKEFTSENLQSLFGDNSDLAKRVLQSSTVEELEEIDEIPRNVIEYFNTYKSLDNDCIIRPLLARGALYYDGVVYEMFHPKLNSAIMGGGRGSMNGVSRVGASFGLERLIICNKKLLWRMKTII